MADNRSVFLAPADLAAPKVGTWTLELATNVPILQKAANAETAIQHVPVGLQAVGEQFQGKQVKSIDIFYTIGTAALTSIAWALYKLTLPADGSAPSAAAKAVTSSKTTTAGKALGDHMVRLTLTEPEILDGDNFFNLEVAFEAAATSVVKVYGARINFS